MKSDVGVPGLNERCIDPILVNKFYGDSVFQITNRKLATKVVVVSIIPWSGVQIPHIAPLIFSLWNNLKYIISIIRQHHQTLST